MRAAERRIRHGTPSAMRRDAGRRHTMPAGRRGERVARMPHAAIRRWAARRRFRLARATSEKPDTREGTISVRADAPLGGDGASPCSPEDFRRSRYRDGSSASPALSRRRA